jgi:hypothetical protein
LRRDYRNIEALAFSERDGKRFVGDAERLGLLNEVKQAASLADDLVERAEQEHVRYAADLKAWQEGMLVVRDRLNQPEQEDAKDPLDVVVGAWRPSKLALGRLIADYEAKLMALRKIDKDVSAVSGWLVSAGYAAARREAAREQAEAEKAAVKAADQAAKKVKKADKAGSAKR